MRPQQPKQQGAVVIDGVEYFRLEAAAVHLGVSLQTLHRRIKSGAIKTERVLGRIRVIRTSEISR